MKERRAVVVDATRVGGKNEREGPDGEGARRYSSEGRRTGDQSLAVTAPMEWSRCKRSFARVRSTTALGRFSIARARWYGTPFFKPRLTGTDSPASKRLRQTTRVAPGSLQSDDLHVSVARFGLSSLASIRRALTQSLGFGGFLPVLPLRRHPRW